MNESVFVDTGFWVALLRKRDQYHATALQWKSWLEDKEVRIVTTEAVFWEVLNLASAAALRRQAAVAYRLCRADASIKVVQFSGHWTQSALELFEARDDKEWSLTDCLSFVVMHKRRLSNALTADHHFVQAGFRALMLETPPATRSRELP